MKGVLLGLILLPAIAVAVLSVRPGGLRQQLRFARRRLKIALILAGIYLVISTAARFALPDGATLDYLEGGVGAALGVTFVVLARDPDPARP